MQQETGAQICIRGKGSVKEGKQVRRDGKVSHFRPNLNRAWSRIPDQNPDREAEKERHHHFVFSLR